MATKRSVETSETVELLPGTFFTELSAGDRLSCQHLRLAPDSRVDTHRHPNEQLTYVLDGEITMIVDGERIPMTAGESLLIPGGVEHAAETGPDAGGSSFDVFSPPREGLPDLD